MDKETQISAVISETTNQLLDQHVRATGAEKGHVVDEALRHHLQALHELPADVIIHPKLVVTRKSGEAILKELETATPTKALRDLMRDGD
jgi:hypothetical protein